MHASARPARAPSASGSRTGARCCACCCTACCCTACSACCACCGRAASSTSSSSTLSANSSAPPAARCRSPYNSRFSSSNSSLVLGRPSSPGLNWNTPTVPARGGVESAAGKGRGGGLRAQRKGWRSGWYRGAHACTCCSKFSRLTPRMQSLACSYCKMAAAALPPPPPGHPQPRPPSAEQASRVYPSVVQDRSVTWRLKKALPENSGRCRPDAHTAQREGVKGGQEFGGALRFATLRGPTLPSPCTWATASRPSGLLAPGGSGMRGVVRQPRHSSAFGDVYVLGSPPPPQKCAHAHAYMHTH